MTTVIKSSDGLKEAIAKIGKQGGLNSRMSLRIAEDLADICERLATSKTNVEKERLFRTVMGQVGRRLKYSVEDTLDTICEGSYPNDLFFVERPVSIERNKYETYIRSLVSDPFRYIIGPVEILAEKSKETGEDKFFPVFTAFHRRLMQHAVGCLKHVFEPLSIGVKRWTAENLAAYDKLEYLEIWRKAICYAVIEILDMNWLLITENTRRKYDYITMDEIDDEVGKALAEREKHSVQMMAKALCLDRKIRETDVRAMRRQIETAIAIQVRMIDEIARSLEIQTAELSSLGFEKLRKRFKCGEEDFSILKLRRDPEVELPAKDRPDLRLDLGALKERPVETVFTLAWAKIVAARLATCPMY